MKEKNENKNVPISPELVAKAKAGDQAAFSELYQLTNTALYRSIRAMVHNEDTAWDIEQETYLKAYQSLDKLEHNEAFLPWLRRISVNVTATEMSKRLPMNFSDLADEDGDLPEQVDLSIDAQPELAMDRKETSRLVREILSELPEQQHLVLGMHYYEDLSVKEICGLLHLAPSTVKTQLIRGRKHVETRVRALEKQGVKLYGLSPMAFLVALMRRAEPAERAAWSTGRAVMAQAFGDAAATAVPVAAKTFGQVLAGRLLAGAMAVALIGGGIWGGAKLLKNNQRDNPYQPTTVETNERLSGVETPEEIPETIETLPVVTEPAVTEPASPEQPTEAPEPSESEQPTEPTEPEVDPSWPAGTCGENLSWYLKPDGLLVIQGSGAMQNFDEYGSPWYDYYELVTDVSLPVGLTSIGDRAFEYMSGLTGVTIPAGVTSIGEYAFFWCDHLTNVTIPSGVTEISQGAFENCISLTGVTIPQGVTEISEHAFDNCSSLTKVTIPDSVTSIEADAFCDCSSLTNVTIPERVTYIGMGAFDNCDALTSITIPASVTEIEIMAFEACNSLSAIYVAPDNPNYSSQDGVLFDKAKTNLIQYPCGRTDPSYTIPDTVTNTYNDAFYECKTLTSLSLGSGVTRLFSLQDCSALSAIHVSPDNPTYSSQDGVLFNKEKTKLLVYPQAKPDLSYTIPDSVTEIGDLVLGNDAFRACWLLTSVTIPGSVTKIGMYAFDKCSALTNVTICEGVKSISVGACSSCHALASVTIPASVEEIDDEAFGYGRFQDHLTIYGYAGTAAERYANENGAHFVDLAQ